MRADVSADADADAEGTGSGNAMEPKVLANHFVGGPQDLQGGIIRLLRKNFPGALSAPEK